MKRIIPFLLSTVIVSTVFSGCGKVEENEQSKSVSDVGYTEIVTMTDQEVPFVLVGGAYSDGTGKGDYIGWLDQTPHLFSYSHNIIRDPNMKGTSKTITVSGCPVELYYEFSQVSERNGEILFYQYYSEDNKQDVSIAPDGKIKSFLFLEFPEGLYIKTSEVALEYADEMAVRYISRNFPEIDLDEYIITDHDYSSGNKERYKIVFEKLHNGIPYAQIRISMDNKGNVWHARIDDKKAEDVEHLLDIGEIDYYSAIIPVIEDYYIDNEFQFVNYIDNYSIMNLNYRVFDIPKYYAVEVAMSFDVHYTDGDSRTAHNNFIYVYHKGNSDAIQ
ncbi:MAG: hypothetical protein IJO64_04430 [Clostridia bacterium]|nr:hypothetical protein [Clostridia bacterium]